MVTSLLSFHDVSLVWPDGGTALRDVNLEVGKGEFVAIVGPSGCGKSTLLRLASGLLLPTSGEVTRRTSLVEFVFQDPTLLPWLDVEQNVALSLTLAGSHDPATVLEALSDVGLERDLDKLPRQLSGGMKMRTSVARALVTRPELFLLDEPFSAIDEMRREELNALLLDLHERRGFAALFVTHSISEAVLLADRVIVLSAHPGQIHEIVHVPLPRARRLERRFDQEFTGLARRISESLKAAST
jgi:NitT/TauT family transport system ATP-binding protein